MIQTNSQDIQAHFNEVFTASVLEHKESSPFLRVVGLCSMYTKAVILYKSSVENQIKKNGYKLKILI